MTPDSDDAETILEYVVRERLGRPQIRELLDGFGSPTSGSRDEMAERLLAVRGLKDQDLLKLLDIEDLKRVQKRFAVPAPSGSTSLLGMLVGDEKGDLIKAISKVSGKQRPPRPKSAPAAEPPRPQAPAATIPPAVPTPHQPAPPPVPTPSPPTGPAPSTPPSFEAVRAFIHDYEFAYTWKDEEFYEAELLGALRGFFGRGHVIRQQAESGRRYDIVVRNAARVEMKMPATKAELDRMSGQVERYLAAGGLGVIVVICGNAMKNRQDIHDSEVLLTGKGATVFVKA